MTPLLPTLLQTQNVFLSMTQVDMKILINPLPISQHISHLVRQTQYVHVKVTLEITYVFNTTYTPSHILLLKICEIQTRNTLTIVAFIIYIVLDRVTNMVQLQAILIVCCYLKQFDDVKSTYVSSGLCLHRDFDLLLKDFPKVFFVISLH